MVTAARKGLRSRMRFFTWVWPRLVRVDVMRLRARERLDELGLCSVMVSHALGNVMVGVEDLDAQIDKVGKRSMVGVRLHETRRVVESGFGRTFEREGDVSSVSHRG